LKGERARKAEIQVAVVCSRGRKNQKKSRKATGGDRNHIIKGQRKKSSHSRPKEKKTRFCEKNKYGRKKLTRRRHAPIAGHGGRKRNRRHATGFAKTGAKRNERATDIDSKRRKCS